MELKNFIEHTLLKQDATKEELIKLFEEAIKYEFLGICVNPCHVKYANEYLKNYATKIVTVIGFPLGATKTEVKAFEANQAVKDGADEIDMVLNVGEMKNKNYDFIIQDIKIVKDACENKKLKVILETDLLTPEEIKKATELCVEGGCDFVKTSTGFVKNGIGATVEAVEIMASVVKNTNVQIKASAGIKTKDKAVALINAGASRLGTSSGVELVN
ncbi:deoxyribose-phosphate aldolase [bacterium]|nr:deoxyribose-phosphate aldolase [bacterium]